MLPFGMHCPIFTLTLIELEAYTILTSTVSGRLDPSALKDLIVSDLDNDKALDIEIIELKDQSAIADYMVIASGTSSRQVISLANKLKDKLNARGYQDIRLEGVTDGNWVILDAGDIVVHLFRPEVRDFYQIEKMWRVPVVGLSSEGMRTA
ncbi:MAG: ribosome silencing factor [Pseudomonadota bacterium]